MDPFDPAALFANFVGSADEFYLERGQLLSYIHDQEAAMYAADPNARRVDPSDLLSDETCLMAMASVTEAIYRASLGKKKFGLVDNITLGVAKNSAAAGDPISNDTRVARPRQELFIAWIEDQDGGLVGDTQSNEVKKDMVGKGLRHLFLVHISVTPSGIEIFRMDSSPGFFQNLPRVRDSITKVIKQLQLHPNPNAPLRHVEQGVAKQLRTTCGIHTVINAWTRALGLGVGQPTSALDDRDIVESRPSAFTLDPAISTTFYEDGAALINLALAGRLSSEVIFMFLKLYDYVNPMACPEPELLRRFDKTVAIADHNALVELHWKAGHLIDHLVSRGYKLSTTTETSAQIELLDCLDSMGLVQPGNGNWRMSTQSMVTANRGEAQEEQIGVLLSVGYVVEEDLEPGVLADWYALHQRGRISPLEAE